MQFYDLVGDGKTYAGAVDLLIGFVEFILYLGEILRLYAAAVVGYDYLDGALFKVLIHLHAYHAALGGVLEGVVYNIEEDLLETVAVAVDYRHFLGVVIQQMLALG